MASYRIVSFPVFDLDTENWSRFSSYSHLADSGTDGKIYREPDVTNLGESIVYTRLLDVESDEARIDSGLVAWSQVLVGHLVSFNEGGFLNSFGIFQAYYTQNLHYAPSNVSWIGSLQFFLTLFVGTFSGKAMDAGYYRHVTILGYTLQVIGVFMTSVSTKYYQLLLAQGFCQGLGTSLVYTPTIALVSTYFHKRRSLAIALSNAGTATGGVVLPIVAQQLLPRIGIAWTLRVMGLIMLFNAIIASALARPRRRLQRSGPFLETIAFKDAWYCLLGLGMLLAQLGQYIGFFYIVSFAENKVKVSPSISMSLLLVMNIMGLPGRAIPAWVADHLTGPLNMLIGLTFMNSVMFFAWVGIDSLAQTWVFVIVFGFFASGTHSMYASAIARLKPDPSKFGTHQGMMFSIMSFGLLGGPPIAGALLESANGDYLYVQIFAGTVAIMGVVLLLIARGLAVGWSPFART